VFNERDQFGDKNPHARLNAAQVIQIKHRLLAGEHSEDIAPDYGVSKWTVYDIRKGATWIGVGPSVAALRKQRPAKSEKVKRSVHWAAKLTEPDVKAIRRRYWNDFDSMGTLAREYGVSVGCIQAVVEGRSWADEVNL